MVRSTPRQPDLLTEPVVPSNGHDDLQSFMETLTDGVIFLDREWRITYANRSARRISRILPEDIDSRSHWELYPDTVGTDQERVYRRSMEERKALHLEFYYPAFNLWISLQTLPIPTGIAVHYRDISSLKQAEAKRDTTAAQLQQIFEVTTDAVAILDRAYNIVFLNRRAKELLAPSGNVIGKNLWTSFPGTVYQGSPFVQTYKRAMNEGIAGTFEAFYPEPLNIWLSVQAQPAEAGIIVFFRDITVERAIAEELRRKTEESERQVAEIETVYRTAPIGLALFDPADFRYLRLNDRQAAFFGLKPEQVVGRTLTEMAPIEGLRELFEQVLAGTPVVNYPLEGELISHPGEHRFWTVNYFPVHGADGSVQAISAASLEITAQKQAEKALIQSEKLAAVGRLAASISHEINNPLEAITNLLYLIQHDSELPYSVLRFVEMAQLELGRVSQITTQTLRFHRQSMRPSRIGASQLMEPVLRLFQGRLINSGIRLQQQLSTPLQITCFENEIRQVLSNLIGNAIDAMRTGGRLTLRAHQATQWKSGIQGLRITVADTGSGISEATIKRIFEPFFTTKDLNGTGLGLWISEEIVKRHHGQLTVRSSDRRERSGSVFSLFLPVGSEETLIKQG